MIVISNVFDESESERTYEFAPNEDISAIELARLIPLILSHRKNINDGHKTMQEQISFKNGQEDEIEALADNLSRHFRRL